ncbi:hypothetical protein Tco_1127223 [Tanacetum coccineum]
MTDFNSYFLNWKLMVLKYQLKMQIISFSDLCPQHEICGQEIQGASKTSSSAQNVAFVSQSKIIYSLFAKQSEDWDLLHEDLKQIDDVDIEEMDINWQIAMIAIRMKKFY